MYSSLSSIPEYPQRCSLSLNHKELIQTLYDAQAINHSSTNFTNLFILDIDNTTSLSRIENVLLIEQRELQSGRPYYTCLFVDTPAQEVITKLAHKGITNLAMFPYKMDSFSIDIDNCDYLYNTKETASMYGKEYANFRRKVNVFARTYNPTLREMQADEYDALWNFSNEIYNRAARKMPSQHESLRTEQLALEKTITFLTRLTVQIHGLFVQERLCAFSVTEIINTHMNRTNEQPVNSFNSPTLLIHFFRVDTSYKGISEYLFHALASEYSATTSLINFEQDLGIHGLRRFKRSLRPIAYITSYSYLTEPI